MSMRKSGFLIAGALLVVLVAMIGSVYADDNVREVQTKLRDDGFYFGEIDGAYSSGLSAALTRFQIRNGLPITGQLDADTSKALGAKPAVTASPSDPAQTSETWRRLRKRDQQFLAQIEKQKQKTTSGDASDRRTDRAPSVENQMSASPATTTASATRAPEPPASPPSQGSSPTAARVVADNSNSSSAGPASTEQLRDYVGAFILAGLDPQVGAEENFFADRVQYYDDGMKGRAEIRKDLRSYDARWPERKFWLAGDIQVQRQRDNRLRVTFPLRFELRNGSKHSSGKVEKTIVVEPAGDDLQIVAVNERKASD